MYRNIRQVTHACMASPRRVTTAAPPWSCWGWTRASEPDCDDLHRFGSTTGTSATATLEILDVVVRPARPDGQPKDLGCKPVSGFTSLCLQGEISPCGGANAPETLAAHSQNAIR